MSLIELKQMTLNEINELGVGYLKKTEGDLNNQMQLLHQTSALISIAVNSPSDFPKEPPKIEIVKENISEEEKENRRLKNLKATACRIWSM